MLTGASGVRVARAAARALRTPVTIWSRGMDWRSLAARGLNSTADAARVRRLTVRRKGQADQVGIVEFDSGAVAAVVQQHGQAGGFQFLGQALGVGATSPAPSCTMWTSYGATLTGQMMPSASW